MNLDPFRSYSKSAKSKEVTVKSCDSPTVTVKTCDSPVVTVKTCDSPTVTIKTNDKALTGLKTTLAGGGTTSSSGGTTVTVSGGTSSGNSTDEMLEGLSLDVSASGTVSAPMETQTSAPSTDVTTGTEWDYPNYPPSTQTAYTGGTDGSGDDVNTDDGIRYYYEDGKGYTETPYGSEFEGHTHPFYKPYHHYHPIYGIRLRIPALSIPRDQFTHKHKIEHYHTVNVTGGASGGRHTHSFTVPNHTHTISEHSHNLPDLSHSHNITLNSHSHQITLNSHSHQITLNPHSHDIKLNGHTHDIVAGIFTTGKPKNFQITVGDNVLTASGTNVEMNITEALLKDGKVPRGQWIKISVTPDDLAYISVFGNTFAFIQSYTGGNF